MKDLLTLLDEYLATRRALGAGLADTERMLRSFLAFLGQREAACMTTQLALQWATDPSQALPAWQARRLGVVRAFAHYASAADPCHEVPPAGLLTARYRRATPYIYSDKEIADLIGAAQQLRGNTDLRGLHLLHAPGVAGCHRDALVRAVASGPERCRSRQRRADGPDFQVREEC